MDSFDDILKGIFAGLMSGGQRDRIGYDTVGEYIIDTCDTVDKGWETAICKTNGDWVVAARYTNKEEAEAGHKTWCSFCKVNEPQYIFSPQTDKIEVL